MDKNTNINLPINDKLKGYDNLKSNIEDWQLSSLSFASIASSTSNPVKKPVQQPSKVQILDKRTLSSSASTTSSMVIIN